MQFEWIKTRTEKNAETFIKFSSNKTKNWNNPLEAFILNVTTSIGDPPPSWVLPSIKKSKLVLSKQTKIHIYQSSMILKSETQKSLMMEFIFTRISKSGILIISKQSGFWRLHWRNCFYNQLNPNLGGLFEGSFWGGGGRGNYPLSKTR